MEIKLEFDTQKATKAAVAITTTYWLCCVSKQANDNNLPIVNAFAIIILIVILYGPCLMQK